MLEERVAQLSSTTTTSVDGLTGIYQAQVNPENAPRSENILTEHCDNWQTIRQPSIHMYICYSM